MRSDSDIALTVDGQTMGTPAYMPPEQAEGKIDQIDHRSDIYSLGAILYEILTLERPIEGDSLQKSPDGVPALRRDSPGHSFGFASARGRWYPLNIMIPSSAGGATMTLELTEDQGRAIEAAAESPPHVVAGGKEYVLIRLETYQQVKAILEAEEIDPSLYEFDEVLNP